ncbi:MAG: protein kinase [Gemmatimonadota bacterium]|nr:protein kinase [Gemmatimonadota bacterium]
MAPTGDPLRDKLRELFGGEIDIERELGRGGMAVVYAGFDTQLQRRVAVKVLLPEIANDRSMADRFLREARTVAALQHPHVVTVYSVRSRDGVDAIVMQFVEGRSLDAVLRDGRALPVPVAGMLLAQAAAGLQHAHDRGVIHRDVKPANVLIDADGRAIVSDFGIARRDHGPRTTETGLVVGTWAYMSPEQRTADALTPATDQYALGVMAFELLTGQLPYTGSPGEMLRAHMHDPPPSVRTLRPEVSPAVDALVQRMMAKLPGDRLSSLRDAERVFQSLVASEGKTTMQLAAFSRGRLSEGSTVVAAIPRAGIDDPRSAPTARASAPTMPVAPGTLRAAPPGVPGVSAPEPASRKWSAIGGAVAGLAVLVVAYVLVQGRTPDGVSSSRAPTTPPQSELPAAQPVVGGQASTVAGAPSSQAPAPRAAAPPQQPGSSPTDVRIGGAGSVIGTVPLASPSGAERSPAATARAADSSARTQPPEAAPDRPVVAPTRTEPAVPSAPAMPAAALADARRIGREFVTLLNQRRHREVAQIPMAGGDAAARAELIRLTESAADFGAGFDRVCSAPDRWSLGFETECILDLTWRGGQKLIRVRLFATPVESGWKLAGVAVDPGG